MDATAQITGKEGRTDVRRSRIRRLVAAGDPRLEHTAETPVGLAGRDTFELALAALSETVEEAARGHEEWLERVRAGLMALLAFFEDSPRRAHLLLDHSRALDGELVLGREQRLLGVLTGLLDDGSPLVLGEVMTEPRLVSELVAAGVVAVVRRRLLASERGAFVALAPELTAFVVAPYLGEAAAREQLRELAPYPALPLGSVHAGGRVFDLPIRVTHRTTLVLQAIAQAPGASNRDLMSAAGPIDEGQLSKLLTRLAQRGLIENSAHGEPTSWPNAWQLTAAGERVLGVIGAGPAHRPRRSGSGSDGT